MTQDKSKMPANKGQADPKALRQERLNQALRDNLKKRKRQTKARKDVPAKTDTGD
ncbi:MAG: hypothetical protein OQK24_06605 [Magnetovibrio sp.]|nr:hypothetical protein [Magnetovibrio sp.]